MRTSNIDYFLRFMEIRRSETRRGLHAVFVKIVVALIRFHAALLSSATASSKFKMLPEQASPISANISQARSARKRSFISVSFVRHLLSTAPVA